MPGQSAAKVRRPRIFEDTHALLNALPDPILVVDAVQNICFANSAAEQFFDMGSAMLCRHTLADLLPFGSPLITLCEQALAESQNVSEYGVDLGTPRSHQRVVDIMVSLIPEAGGYALIKLQQRAIADKMNRLLTHRGAARSVAGMAAVLAHEIKNPLSGIRGSAQLLEENASVDDRPLTQLICDETDRICDLVDRMEVFAEHRRLNREPVNIHQVLEHVRQLAEAGFARRVRFEEDYDPSLPRVLGNRDQLIQVLLNLVKNAAEAVEEPAGLIVLSTAFRHGVRLAVPGSQEKVGLPIEVVVSDNGSGVAEDIRPYLYEPFVSTKETGSGLGLAMVAKIVGDHGGVIECDSEPGQTSFRILLPVAGDLAALDEAAPMEKS